MASHGQAHGASHAAPGAAAADPFLLLREALLVEVLRHVGDQRELLGSCALVSTAWRSAAAAACSSIELELSWWNLEGAADQARVDGLCDWLARSGGGVTQLKVDADSAEHRLQLSLPLGRLPRLQQLAAWGFTLLDAGSTEPQLQPQPQLDGDTSSMMHSQCLQGPALAGLTHLRLFFVRLHWRGGLEPLAACSALRELALRSVTVSAGEQLEAQLCRLLQRLPQLTLLGLGSVCGAAEQCMAGAALASSLSCLTQLRDLELSCKLTPASLAGLGACRQLTRLCVWQAADAEEPPQLTARSAPGISQLTVLQHLQLESVQLEPALLAGLPRLRHISLHSCTQQPQGSAGVAALLRALAAHTALEHLALRCSLASPAPAPEACSALTASTALTQLDLRWCELPPGCGRHLFPPGRRLPRLAQLDLVSWEWQPPGEGEAAPPPLLGDGDVARLVACCPGLVDLTATPALAARLPVAELAKLSALTSLDLGGPLFDDAEAQQLAARLPSLRSLCVRHAEGFTDLGLCALTGLTRLTRLSASNKCGLSSSVADEHGMIDLRAGEEPVWQQLQRRCEASPACFAVLQQQRTHQLSDAQARLAA